MYSQATLVLSILSIAMVLYNCYIIAGEHIMANNIDTPQNMTGRNEDNIQGRRNESSGLVACLTLDARGSSANVPAVVTVVEFPITLASHSLNLNMMYQRIHARAGSANQTPTITQCGDCGSLSRSLEAC
jgi:hypothetical protein